MQYLKGFYLFFVGILLIAGVYIAPPYFVLPKERAAESFQEKINTTESRLQKELEQLHSSYSKNQLQQEIAFFQKENTSYFIIEDNEMVFWSDNKANYQLSKLLDLSPIQKESNGVFLKQYIHHDDVTYIALEKVKNDFSIQNQFLSNVFTKTFQFSAIKNIDFSEGNVPVYSSEKKLLFYLQLQRGEPSNTVIAFFGLVLLVSIYFLLFLFPLEFKKIYFLPSYIAVVLRIWLFFFLPPIFEDLKIFQPKWFAINEFIPSVGDLLLHFITLFIVSYQLKRFLKFSKSKLLAVSTYLISIILGVVFIMVIEESILSSIINYDIRNLFLIDYLSIVAFTAFIFLALSVTLFIGLSIQLLKSTLSQRQLIGIVFLSSLVGFIVVQLFSLPILYLWHFVVFLFLIQRVYYASKRSILSYILFLFYLCAIVSYGIGEVADQKRDVQQSNIALKLAEERDPIAEYLFDELQTNLLADSFLYHNSQQYWLDQEAIDLYLKENYFNSYWNKYQVNFSICSEYDEFLFDNSSNTCVEYFLKRIQSEGDMISSNNLFQLTNYAGRIDYIGDIQYQVDSIPFHLFIELSSIYLNENEGYPELLIDKSLRGESLDLAFYEYAVYNKKELLYKNSSYNYSTHLPTDELSPNTSIRYQADNYHHLVYQKDRDVSIVISRKQSELFDFFTELAYILILFGFVFTIVVLSLPHFPFHFRLNFQDFSTKIQLFLVGSIITSLLFLAWGTTYYIQKQYQAKNENALAEKIRSINLELESKIRGEEYLSEELKEYVASYLVKFSNVFYSDINLYNKDGKLYATSRPELFAQGIQGSLMEPNAFYGLAKSNKSEWIQQEKIGSLSYISAYIPFKNYDNEVLGYLSLPYFAKQGELEEEISTFLVSTLNIYVGIFVISLLISVLLVNQLARPLRLIRKQISKLKLGSSIELIQWNSKDEIGALVKEYNRIAIDLNESAEALAKSEREVAWREMAKQVAHEIKNPLTPMKLSIQHLQMAANAKSHDLEERINKTTQTLVEQIEALSEIATAFSSFAKLPSKEYEELALLPILTNTIHLYSHDVPIDFTESEGAIDWMVKGDKDQLLRVFNNLLKNAVQAVDQKEEPSIKVKLFELQDHYEVQIIDNGVGISETLAERIFEPNFTTKTSGSGLGLAMSKSIINQMEGNISFDSVESEGTTFKIELKKA